MRLDVNQANGATGARLQRCVRSTAAMRRVPILRTQGGSSTTTQHLRRSHDVYQKILVPFDGSATSAHGLQEAIAIVKLTHGRLRLMHVIDELSIVYAGWATNCMPALRKEALGLLESARQIVQAEGVEVDTVLHDTFEGVVFELIVAEAARWPADLIVIGTHGRRGFDRLTLGSSAENVLRHATVPVLLVRGPSPVAPLVAQRQTCIGAPVS
ncbi:universal stress protein [Variovorax sp. VaC1]|uniref:universal stress protein n=1 Tax=Variovorax sp. VaC1 TaxID=3373132 RepID=UPI003747AE42